MQATLYRVWVRGAAIRPVPPYAVVEASIVSAIERDFAGGDGEDERPDIDEAFARFERTQPVLASRIQDVLSRPLDETALALGYFLTIVVWLAFERTFASRLGGVAEEDLETVEAQLLAEEELRMEHSHEPIDVDDVVAREQPAILRFVHEHVDAALDVTSHAPDESDDIDVDDVHDVYRAVVLLTLALSHAVRPSHPAPPSSTPMLQ
jgi:hypothetical protein